MRYLFVGGSHDGERIEVQHPPSASMKLPSKKQEMEDIRLYKPHQYITQETEIYVRRNLTSSDGSMVILYVLNSITDYHMLLLLVDWYKNIVHTP